MLTTESMTLKRQKKLNALRLAGLAAALSAIPVLACSVPVFRYALEHWAADSFQAVVFHRGPLSDAHRALVNDLGPNGLAGRLRANLSPKTVDLAANPPAELRGLLPQSDTETLPWLVLRSPRTVRAATTILSGPLDRTNLTQLLDSPARQELTRRLGRGESAVWVLLESGDRTKDAATTDLLASRLAYLMSTLQLPKLDAHDLTNGLVSVGQEDLRLEFSTLRIARDDPQEAAFVQMLLGIEADLRDVKDPIVFPIFGQGRALYALVGGGIKRETIDQAAMFLIGKCSCQVKEQNPGIDLLFAADWKRLIKTDTAAFPDLPTMAELKKSAPETVVISGSGDGTTTGDNAGWNRSLPSGKMFALAGGVGIGLLLAVVLLLRRKK
jgi:hypothetical protein